MFVLCELRNRAETTDTLLLYISNSKKVLEHKKDEIYKQMLAVETEWAIKENYDVDKLPQWCQERMNNYHIVEVPYLEE